MVSRGELLQLVKLHSRYLFLPVVLLWRIEGLLLPNLWVVGSSPTCLLGVQ